MRFVPAFAGLFCAIVSVPAIGVGIASFDADAQGWSALTADSAAAGLPLQVAAPALFLPTGGNPSGHIAFLDPDGFDSFFRAPASFLGDQSFALGGTLGFDTITDQAIDYNGPDIVIKGGGVVLVYDVAPPVGTGTWSHVSLSIAPTANWHLNTAGGPLAAVSDFQTALVAVSEFWITAEYHNGATETTGLDNVSLSTVPEPTTLAGLTLSLGWAAMRRPRFGRRIA